MTKPPDDNGDKETQMRVQAIGKLGGMLHASMMPGETVILDIEQGSIITPNTIHTQKSASWLIITRPVVRMDLRMKVTADEPARGQHDPGASAEPSRG